MSNYANPLLFNAHALPVSIEEAHAQLGNHLRVNHHPLFGLPIAPFVVYRAEERNRKRFKIRQDALFLDRNNATIFPPFDVTPEAPVTIRLPSSDALRCIWARVRATKAQGEAEGLRCAAYVNAAAFGPALVGQRSNEPYAFSAPGLVEFKVTGKGTVFGIEWLDGADMPELDFRPWSIMNLPHKGGARYLNIVNPMSHVDARIVAQAPKRKPLQETINTPAPAAAALYSETEERSRIDSLALSVADDLDLLITDPTPPLQQIMQIPVEDQNGVKLATDPNDVSVAEMSRIDRFNQLQLDPGCASLIGYKTLDDSLVEVEDIIVVYRIAGFFRDFPQPAGDLGNNQVAFDSALASVPNSARSLDRDDVFKRFIALASPINGVNALPVAEQQLEAHNDYVMLETYAVADRDAPLDQVEAPLITGSEHKVWLPAVPPAARREVETGLANVRVAGLLAAGKRQPATGAGVYSRINKKNEGGFHLPMMLGLSSADGSTEPPDSPGVGFISDRQVNELSLNTFVAQQDRFGRWSQWASLRAPEGVRPKPPRPHIQGYYEQPPASDAATTGGTITVHVAVPDIESLAPGSLPLSHVRIFADDSVNPVQTFDINESTKTTFDDSTVPVAERRFVVVHEFTGPVLQLTEQRRMNLTAKWVDTAGQLSVLSEPHRLRMTDPRAPTQLVVPDHLLYSARPDITGLAWVEHRWTPQAGQSSYGIYYTDENRLLQHLREQGNLALANQIRASEDAAQRAGLLRDNQSLFPDSLYERLQDINVTFNSGEVGFRHGLSGSLRILSAYKIAAESDSGAKPVLTDLDMILYGVPNSDPPPRPTLDVRPTTAIKAIESTTGTPVPGTVVPAAELTISVVSGTTPGDTWRLRRTRSDNAAVQKMPIVDTGTLPVSDDETGKQIAMYTDTGPVVIARTAQLSFWTRYAWVAEVQGASESGSSVPGHWSKASDPVSLILIPETAPAPLQHTGFGGTRVVDGFREPVLNVKHPGSLASGASGYFSMRVARRLPGATLEIIDESDITELPLLAINGFVSEREVVPLGAEFILTIVDPIGRASEPTVVTLN